MRDVTREVLARAEFQPSQPTFLDRVLDAFSDLLGRVFEALAGGGQGSIVGTVIVVIVVGLLAVATAWFLRNVRRDPAQRIAVDAAIGRTPADWLGDAEIAERAGAWREALRCRYRALLAELAAEGLVEEVAGRTTGEYLAAVRQDVPDAAGPFAQATRAFEVAWYGAGSTTRDDVEEFATHARSTMLTATGKRAPARVA